VLHAKKNSNHQHYYGEEKKVDVYRGTAPRESDIKERSERTNNWFLNKN
jgi:hypothetical protein